VKLILFHSAHAKIDCQDCQKYIYDFDKGERRTYKSGPQREERPMVRPKSTPPPCHKCPLESPEKAHKHRLNDRNVKTFILYHRSKSTNGLYLNGAERTDPIVARNFSIIDSFYRRKDSIDLASEIAQQLAPFFMK